MISNEQILLVDDTPKILDMVRTILDEEGYEVLVATSGKKAIEKAELINPTLILLDILMPDIDGYETCKLLKQNPKTKEIPIIFLSALADTFDKVKAFKAGAVDYITKPIQTDELIARIETHLTINRLQKSLQKSNYELEKKVKERTTELEEANNSLMSVNQLLEETVEELKISKHKAEESDKLKTAFLANMSHEIRTPMNAVIGFADLLDDEDITDNKRKEYIAFIKDNSMQLLSIINDIIDISRIEAGITNIYESEINVIDLLIDIINSFEYLIQNKGLELKENFNKNDKILLVTDQAKARQIITNLISNAIKFTDKGYIEIGIKNKNTSILIYIKDTGIGISDKLHNVIFEPFRQAELSYTRKYGGTGLGLAISKTYTKILNGSLWLESEFGKGTTFFVELPAKQATTETPKNHNKETKLDDNYDKKTILVAEDEETNFLYLKELLNKLNAKVLHAEHGEIACKMVQQHPEISLVLIDIKMPIMNGIEATKIIKKLKPELPVIAQTAYAMHEDKKRALEAGCDDYISKPIRKTVLIDIISKHIKQ